MTNEEKVRELARLTDPRWGTVASLRDRAATLRQRARETDDIALQKDLRQKARHHTRTATELSGQINREES